MTEVHVRPATPKDLGAITAIYNEAVLNTTASWDEEPVTVENRRAWLHDHTSGRNAAFVAEDGGEVVGFAGYGRFRLKSGYDDTVEHSVYLRADARGRGTGTALMQAIVDTARARGFHALIGGLSADNEASLKLHENFGFVEVARMPQVGRKFGNWLDLVYVQLTLDERALPGDPLPTE